MRTQHRCHGALLTAMLCVQFCVLRGASAAEPAQAAASNAAPAAPQSIGQVIAITGKAVAVDAAGTERALLLKSPVFARDRIMTGAGAKLQVMFRDDSVISQGENSTVEINEYVYNPGDKKKSRCSLGILRGIFRVITGKITELNPERFAVRTRMATIGIRGCELGFRVTEKEEKIYIIELPQGKVITIQTTGVAKGLQDKQLAGGRVRKTELLNILQQGKVVTVREGQDMTQADISIEEARRLVEESTPVLSEDEGGTEPGGTGEDTGSGGEQPGETTEPGTGESTTGESTSEPATTTEPSGETGGETPSGSSTEPAGEPSGEPAAEPAVEPTGEPTQPAAEPGTQPAGDSTAPASGEPAPQPSGDGTSGLPPPDTTPPASPEPAPAPAPAPTVTFDTTTTTPGVSPVDPTLSAVLTTSDQTTLSDAAQTAADQAAPSPAPAPAPAPSPAPAPVVTFTRHGGGLDWDWGVWDIDGALDKVEFKSGSPVSAADFALIRDGATLYQLAGAGDAAAVIQHAGTKELVTGNCNLNVRVGMSVVPTWSGSAAMNNTAGDSCAFDATGTIQSDGKLTGNQTAYSMRVHGTDFARHTITAESISGNLVGPGSAATPPISGVIGTFHFAHGSAATVTGGFGADLK